MAQQSQPTWTPFHSSPAPAIPSNLQGQLVAHRCDLWGQLAANKPTCNSAPASLAPPPRSCGAAPWTRWAAAVRPGGAASARNYRTSMTAWVGKCSPTARSLTWVEETEQQRLDSGGSRLALVVREEQQTDKDDWMDEGSLGGIAPSKIKKVLVYDR